MPIYEYRCSQCGKRESKFWRSLAAVDEQVLTCSTCGSKRMSRLVSKVRVLRGGSGGADPSSGGAAGENGDMDGALMREMEGLDENDPRALGRFMRKMAAETGESMGPEFDEVVGRLEKGEDPEKIERDMGELLGGAEGDMGMGEDGLPTAAPESPSTETAGKSARRRPTTAKSTKPTKRTKSAPAANKGKRKNTA